MSDTVRVETQSERNREVLIEVISYLAVELGEQTCVDLIDRLNAPLGVTGAPVGVDEAISDE